MLTLFTDTDTDITPEIAKEYGYKLISMPYIVDGNVIYPYRDFEHFDSKKFYDMLRGGTLPTTCALSPQEYIDYFEPEFAKGNDIFYVHFSKAMTATFGFMHEALEQLQKKYPERKFYEVDTKGITIESYNQVLEIGDMFKKGATAEEVLKWAETEVDHFAIYFYADDLKFFRRSGRVSGLAAFMGNIIGIHPIIYMDEKGVMTNCGKEKGRIRALNKIVSYVADFGDDIKNHRIIIGHTDALDIAEILGGLLKEKFGDGLPIEYVVVNPTAGSHCGPNGVGVCFHAKHR